MAVRKKYDHNVLGRGLDNIGTGRGMGLDALINTNDINTQGTSNLNEIAIELIEPNPDQPRHEFDENALNELAASIREIGIITPITVREMPSGHYQIIAGERRWRASQLAGLTSMPAYIKTTDDKLTMEMALVENIQREDLNATVRVDRYDPGAYVGALRQKPYLDHQLHASVKTTCTDTDGIKEPRYRHGTCTCTTLT